MKKILLIIALLLAVLLFASCKEQPEEVSKSISELTDLELKEKVGKATVLDLTLQSGSLDIKTETIIEEVGKKTNINSELELKNVNKTNEKVQKYYRIHVNTYDVDVIQEYVLKDGMIYVSGPNGKYYSTGSGDTFDAVTNGMFHSFIEKIETEGKVTFISETDEYYEVDIPVDDDGSLVSHSLADRYLDLDNAENYKAESLKATARILKSNKVSSINIELVTTATINGRAVKLTTKVDIGINYDIPTIELPENKSEYVELPNIYTLETNEKIVYDSLDGFMAFKTVTDLLIKSDKAEYSNKTTANVEIISPNNVLKYKISGDIIENGEKYELFFSYDGKKLSQTIGDKFNETTANIQNAYGYVYTFFDHVDVMSENSSLRSIEKDGYKTTICFDADKEYTETLINSLIYKSWNGIGAYTDLTFDESVFKCVTESDLKGSRLLEVTLVIKGSFEVSGEKYTFSYEKTLDNVKKLDNTLKDLDF